MSLGTIKTVRDLEMRLCPVIAKEESFALSCLWCSHSEIWLSAMILVACCLTLFFICLFTIVYVPYHWNSGPLFHLLICHISDAWSEYWYSVQCCLSTDITHLVHFHFHSLLEKILWQGFSLPSVSWWGSWPTHTIQRSLNSQAPSCFRLTSYKLTKSL